MYEPPSRCSVYLYNYLKQHKETYPRSTVCVVGLYLTMGARDALYKANEEITIEAPWYFMCFPGSYVPMNSIELIDLDREITKLTVEIAASDILRMYIHLAEKTTLKMCAAVLRFFYFFCRFIDEGACLVLDYEDTSIFYYDAEYGTLKSSCHNRSLSRA